MIERFLKGSLKALAVGDFHALLGASETEELEFKGPLPWKDKGPEPWADGKKRLADYTRDELVKEVIALANAGGGVMILGVDDKNNIATSIRPLPHPRELAERLHQIVDSIVEPRLPSFEVHCVDDGPETGLVAIRVAQSWLRPHKHKSYGHCFIRRDTRSEAMSMREVRDMIYMADRGREDIEKRFEARRFRRHTGMTRRCEFRVMGQPLVPLAMGPLKREFVQSMPVGQLEVIDGTARCRPMASLLYIGSTRPRVRSWECTGDSAHAKSMLSFWEDGTLEYRWHFSFDREPVPRPYVYETWFMSAFINGLVATHRMRTAAGTPAALYELETEIMVEMNNLTLVQAGDWEEAIGGISSELFPRYFVGRSDAFNDCWRLFYVDLYNSAGRTIDTPSFRFPAIENLTDSVLP